MAAVELVAIHERPDLIDAVASIMEDEWPSSMARRRRQLAESSPVSTSFAALTRDAVVVGHAKLQPVAASMDGAGGLVVSVVVALESLEDAVLDPQS